MFTVIYKFKVIPDKTEQFINNWEELTKLIYEYEGSYGSRLHRIDDVNFLAYAQWPSKEIWQNSGKNLPETATNYSQQMKAACESSSTDFELEVVSDLLALDAHRTKDDNPKVTGIGGVFFKGKDPEKLKQWYADNLGLNTDQYGTMFSSRNLINPKDINYLQWSIFSADTSYFKPSNQAYMINYRVQDLEGLVEKLKQNGVTIVDTLETYDYGKFIHILDSEGNKIELWEPIDQTFKID
ncbi:MAG: antibiotic biosynthesis monooxygenase [Putridiphycobacter sp.]|nr:antibiotic biosynthesis monooxygenase [Putridiphycobacter sp.]